MSSSMHLDQDSDTALNDARPWARKRVFPVAEPVLESRTVILASIEAEMETKKLVPKFSGDRGMLRLRRQLALDPDLIPEPSSEGAAGIGPLLTRLCSVSALAAFLAWTLVTYSNVKKTTGDAAADSATVAIANHRINVLGVEPSQLRPAPAQTHIATSKPRPAKIATAEAGNMATAVPAEPAAAPTAPQRATERRELRFDGDEIAIMIKRAKDLLGNGDVAAARLLLRRAAEAGSAEGAFTLGATFDPVSLQRLGAIGAVPDIAKARQWYQRAAELGSNAASQQLAGLGNAP